MLLRSLLVPATVPLSGHVPARIAVPDRDLTASAVGRERLQGGECRLSNEMVLVCGLPDAADGGPASESPPGFARSGLVLADRRPLSAWWIGMTCRSTRSVASLSSGTPCLRGTFRRVLLSLRA